MKIITKTTVRVGKGTETKYLAPGEHTVEPELGDWLVSRGRAEKVGRDEKPAKEQGGQGGKSGDGGKGDGGKPGQGGKD